MHQTHVGVRWGELDAYQHVNHTVYLSYMEAARIEALESIGWGMEQLAEAGVTILVAEITVRFRKPAVHRDRLTVTTEVCEVRPASTTWRQQILRDGEVLVSADLRAAVTTPAGRPVRLPAGFRDALVGLREQPRRGAG